MTIDQPHAPARSCEGCRALFTGDQDPYQATAAELSSIHHRRGYDAIALRREAVAAWIKRHQDRGQAIVEFALVLPILLGLLLAILEAGSFGARWIGYAHLADTMTASAAATGELPEWWPAEATRARCDDAAAAILPGAPRRVELRCTYQGIAVNGLKWSVTIPEVIPD